MKPAGAIGLVTPAKGNLIGRLIAKRQGIPQSHTIVALGNGTVIDSTFKWTRTRDESYWDRREVAWYAPVIPFTEEEARVLRSVCYMIRGRIRYDWWALFQFIIHGTVQGRRHGMFCSYLVAELYLAARDFDLSRFVEPWNVDVRVLVARLHDTRDFIRLEPTVVQAQLLPDHDKS